METDCCQIVEQTFFCGGYFHFISGRNLFFSRLELSNLACSELSGLWTREYELLIVPASDFWQSTDTPNRRWFVRLSSCQLLPVNNRTEHHKAKENTITTNWKYGTSFDVWNEERRDYRNRCFVSSNWAVCAARLLLFSVLRLGCSDLSRLLQRMWMSMSRTKSKS